MRRAFIYLAIMLLFLAVPQAHAMQREDGGQSGLVKRSVYMPPENQSTQNTPRYRLSDAKTSSPRDAFAAKEPWSTDKTLSSGPRGEEPRGSEPRSEAPRGEDTSYSGR